MSDVAAFQDKCALCGEEYEFEVSTRGVCEDCLAEFDALDLEDQLERVLNLDSGSLHAVADKNRHVLKRKY